MAATFFVGGAVGAALAAIRFYVWEPALPAIGGLSEGRIGYLYSGHVQDVPVH